MLALAASEERGDVAVEAAELGTWRWNVRQDEVVGSERTRAILELPHSGTSETEFHWASGVFLAAIHAGLYALAVTGVLLSVVGAYYYLRIVKIMYFDAPAERFDPMPGLLAAVLGASGIFILLYFVYPAPLVKVAAAAAKSLF